eukprot:jgi/Ulvmu1/7538/UM037_0082.1
MESSSGGTLSAAEKKKLRRKKAKQGKKDLRSSQIEVHAALHKAQEAEGNNQRERLGKAPREGDALLHSFTAASHKHVIEYVPEPLTALEALSQAVKNAAIDDNPYDGLSGLEVSEGAGKQKDLDELQRIAQHFAVSEDAVALDDTSAVTEQPLITTEVVTEKEDEKPDPDEAAKSNREIKRERNELTSQMISQLKQECARPEVVEVWDIRARDPKLLVYLKAYRNTVPVPRHWSQKRKYLQGKRGIEKAPFELPSFIQSTGISDMRNALEEKVQEKLKNKGKQRMRPKMGKMDIDYSILHDAFFKYQDKPTMSRIGELYYEGKEYEMRPTNAYPGLITAQLKDALGMTEGAPPPWLINMQRYGPPPSYPSLKIPGLNAPIPDGSDFGYHPGGWGKPPVDHQGQPLYGDVFGQQVVLDDDLDEAVKTQRWGELEDDDEESSESEEEEPEEPVLTEEQLDQGIASGMMTGLSSSLEAGISTDASLEMRKSGGASTAGPAPALYTVLEQEDTAAAAEGLSAVGHTYKMPNAARPANAAARKRLEAIHGGQGGDVDIAVDPEELDRLGEKGLQQLYQQAAGGNKPDDFSDMFAANAAARKRKMQDTSAKGIKKAKETFKF